MRFHFVLVLFTCICLVLGNDSSVIKASNIIDIFLHNDMSRFLKAFTHRDLNVKFNFSHSRPSNQETRSYIESLKKSQRICNQSCLITCNAPVERLSGGKRTHSEQLFFLESIVNLGLVPTRDSGAIGVLPELTWLNDAFNCEKKLADVDEVYATICNRWDTSLPQQPHQHHQHDDTDGDGDAHAGSAEFGGGSGFGFQLYCDRRLVLSAGAGGGGGLTLRNGSKPSLRFGGGGGGGVQLDTSFVCANHSDLFPKECSRMFTSDTWMDIGGGGGCLSHSISHINWANISSLTHCGFALDEAMISNNLTSSEYSDFIAAFSGQLAACSRINVLGGGGGGGGTASCCQPRTGGYGFSFRFTDSEPSDLHNDSAATSSRALAQVVFETRRPSQRQAVCTVSHFSGPLIHQSRLSKQCSEYGWDWSCICTSAMRLYNQYCQDETDFSLSAIWYFHFPVCSDILISLPSQEEGQIFSYKDFWPAYAASSEMSNNLQGADSVSLPSTILDELTSATATTTSPQCLRVSDYLIESSLLMDSAPIEVSSQSSILTIACVLWTTMLAVQMMYFRRSPVWDAYSTDCPTGIDEETLSKICAFDYSE